MANPTTIQLRAQTLIEQYLSPEWSFGFDRAVRRAGLCNFTKKRITLSLHLARLNSDEEVEQTLLHEIAHALVGPEAGHGKLWKQTAAQIGYHGGTKYNGPSLDQIAPWEGICPGGHRVYRHRKATRPSSCAKCAPQFDKRYLIEWRKREIKQRERHALANY